MGNEPSVSAHKGGGSTNVMFDLRLDEKSNCRIAFSPEKLDRMIRKAIKLVKMKRRKGILDVWESKQFGPATSFHSLQESHVRVETWPKECHVQGEVQLCNFSRDNSAAARRLADLIIENLKPATTQRLVITRGPGTVLLLQESTEGHKRSMD